MLRFGTDGVRGEAFTELTTDDVVALGRAAARVIDGNRWIVGRDPRESGPTFAAALATGLRAEGRVVDLAGVLPTPAIAGAAARLDVPAAMITASHNPASDNGIKIFAAGGLKLADDVEARIEAALHEIEDEVEQARPATPVVDPDTEGRDARPELLDQYVAELVAQLPSGCLNGLRVVLDCANGAMSVAAPEAARRLGADVVVIHAEPDGRNINDRCGATDPRGLATEVESRGADLGLAFDGDGDRVIAVDHRGRIVDGDHLLALAALQLRDAGALADDTVVVTVMSNLGFRRAMDRRGITVVETPVGDRHVLAALERGGWSLGGEQSGHIIYRDVATTGDGLLAGLRLGHDVLTRAMPLAELADDAMTSYPQVLVNVRVRDAAPAAVWALRDEVAAAERRLGGDGRVLVRASGTEPLIRVMVEAPTVQLARSVADDLADAVRRRDGSDVSS